MSTLRIMCLPLVILLLVACGGETSTPTPVQQAAASPTPTVAPTPTPTMAPTPTPTQPPRPTPTPTKRPEPKPIRLVGRGKDVRVVRVPFPVSLMTISHRGQSNFILTVHSGGEEELLVNEIGNYDGVRPLFYDGRVLLEIEADGQWSIVIRAITLSDKPIMNLSGKGDYATPLFTPNPRGEQIYLMQHSGQSNFIVYLHCESGSYLIENEIGRRRDIVLVDFGSEGVCMWEVQADGRWSIQLRR